MRQLIVTTFSVCTQTYRSTVREHPKLATSCKRRSIKVRRTSRTSRREISTQTSSRERLISLSRKVPQKAGSTRKDPMHANCLGGNTSPQRRSSAAHSKSNSARTQATSPCTTRQQARLLRSLTLQDHRPSTRASSRIQKDRRARPREYRSHPVRSINTPNTQTRSRRCQPTRLPIQA